MAAPLDLPPVIGHRGAAATAPENTLAGIRQASELGALWIEFDVKLTRDGHAILMHDERLERTTDGAGRVAETTLAEVKRLDAGSWFGPAFRGEPVPTFEEALGLCAELGLGANVELKPCRGREAETARFAMEELLRVWPEDRPAPLVSSFAPDCLEVAREIAPQLPRGLLCNRLPTDWKVQVERHECATVHLNHRWTTARQRIALTAEGLSLVLYTVNSARRAQAQLEAGVTAIITDQIAAVLAALP